jgi:undecaprenyl-diphosphatase
VRIRALVVALIAAAAFFALGFAVVRNGEPPALLAWEHALFDHSALVAWWLTWLCYMQALVPVVIILLVIAWLAPAWRSRVIFSIVMLLLCWRGADFFQHIFGRPRPLEWVVKRETAFAYPSSHAAIATGFYGLWAAMLYLSELPRPTRVAGGGALAILAIAICWSRLALGAHYLTDLVGGALLAIAFVAAGLAIVPVKLFRPAAGRVSATGE